MKGRGIKGEGLLNNLLLREGGQGDRLLDNFNIDTKWLGLNHQLDT